MSYVLIPYLNVRHANALAGQHVINAAPIMAVNLFVHHLARKLGCSREDPAAVRVAVIHHHAQMLGESKGFFFRPQQRRAATFIDNHDYSSKNKYALSLQPVATFHWDLSLVIHFPGPVNEVELQKQLYQGRIAGGQIEAFLASGILIEDECFTPDQLPRGSWIIDRSALLQDEALGNPLDALMHYIGHQHPDPGAAAWQAYLSQRGAPENEDETEAAEEEEPADSPEPEILDFNASLPKSDEAEADADPESPQNTAAEASATLPVPLPYAWLTPTVLGYAALTPFTQRYGVRMTTDPTTGAPLQSPPHAFVEPLLGLVQYVSRARWQAARPLSPIPFWHAYWPQEDVFLVHQPAQFESESPSEKGPKP